MRFSNIQLKTDGFTGTDSGKYDGSVKGCTHALARDLPGQFSASFPLFLIGEAWTGGVEFEDIADGFGKGEGTQGGDWSGIRDSSDAALAEMFQRSLNHFFDGGR